VNYFQNFTLFIQNSLPLNQYIARIDLKVFENSHCTPFVESHFKIDPVDRLSHDILYKHFGIGDHPDVLIINFPQPVTTWRTSKILRWE
jgi:hypothetical protein